MVLLLALKDKADSVTFSRKRGKIARLLYTPEGHGECEMVPPPRHLFPRIMKILRQMGREAAKSSSSAPSFSYTETNHERTLVVSIDRTKGEEVKVELDNLLSILYLKEEAKETLKRIQKKQRAHKKQLIAIGILLALCVATGYPVLVIVFLTAP